MIQSFGQITVPSPGTPVRATSNQADPLKVERVHGFLFQVLPTNTGLVYIGTEGMDKSTGVGVVIRLPVPTASGLPTFSASIPISSNGLMVEAMFVDADVADEGVLVSALIA